MIVIHGIGLPGFDGLEFGLSGPQLGRFCFISCRCNLTRAHPLF